MHIPGELNQPENNRIPERTVQRLKLYAVPPVFFAIGPLRLFP
jgi:hypothetical protein